MLRRDLLLVVVALALSVGACIDEKAPPAIEVEDHGAHYSAVWRAGGPETELLRANHLDALTPDPGFRLVDIDVTLVEGEREFLGLTRAHSGELENVPLVGLDADQLLAPQEGDLAQHCLAAFDAWREQEQTLYAGIWSPDCDDEVLLLDLNAMSFAAELIERGATHHLVDFETVVEDGKLRIGALWHPGAESLPLWSLVGMSWGTFHDHAHDMNEDGYRLMDIDVQSKPVLASVENGPKHSDTFRTVISAVWRADGGKDWLGADYSWEQLDCTKSKLGSGFESSGLDGDGEPICDQEPENEASGDPLQVVVIDAHLAPIGPHDHNALANASRADFSDHHPGATGVHSGVLHDSGTAGPP